MLRVILSNLFKKPATRLYPFEKREPFNNARGHLEFDSQNCIYCGICQKKCPTNCITVIRQEKTWMFESYMCVNCSVCVEACPKKCLTMKADHRTPIYQKQKQTVIGSQE